MPESGLVSSSQGYWHPAPYSEVSVLHTVKFTDIFYVYVPEAACSMVLLLACAVLSISGVSAACVGSSLFCQLHALRDLLRFQRCPTSGLMVQCRCSTDCSSYLSETCSGERLVVPLLCADHTLCADQQTVVANNLWCMFVRYYLVLPLFTTFSCTCAYEIREMLVSVDHKLLRVQLVVCGMPTVTLLS